MTQGPTTDLNSRARMLVLPVAIGLCCAAACREDPLIEGINLPPLANAGESRQIPFDGAPAAVTLDGSGSTDPDGHVVGWRWWTGTARADGDAGISLPAGESDPKWPTDVEKPEVTLPEGVWAFSLWVVDNAGAVSKPAVVKITVGDPDPLADPQVAACANAVLDRVPAACKACVCKVSDACRMNVIESVCDETCWSLIDCIAIKCPDFPQTMDLGCLLDNCRAFLGAGAAAMTTGGCVIPCGNVCNPPS